MTGRFPNADAFVPLLAGAGVVIESASVLLAPAEAQ